MLFMTAKIDKKKVIIGLVAAVLALIAIISALSGGGSQDLPTAAVTPRAGSNEERVKFLTDFGWDVAAAPTESMQVRIPADRSEVFDRYNGLQKSQGFDLSQYTGKSIMRYVYKINNFPNADQPVYATLLVHKDQIIGGDITDTSPGGKVQGFAREQDPQPKTILPSA